MKYVNIACAAIIVMGLSGCATITRGTQQKFQVISEPSEAAVEMSNGLRCTTPCKLKIRRKSDFVVKIIKPGYETAEVAVQGKVKGGGAAGGLVGNALLGGLIGLGVDASSGAMLNLTPNPVSVVLKPVGEAPTAPPSADAAAQGATPAEQPK